MSTFDFCLCLLRINLTPNRVILSDMVANTLCHVRSEMSQSVIGELLSVCAPAEAALNP